MEQKEYWDCVSGKKEFTTPFQMERFSKYVSQKETVLDIGCGYGRTLDELYQNGYHNLVGIDFSKGMITRRRQESRKSVSLKHCVQGTVP